MLSGTGSPLGEVKHAVGVVGNKESERVCVVVVVAACDSCGRKSLVSSSVTCFKNKARTSAWLHLRGDSELTT